MNLSSVTQAWGIKVGDRWLVRIGRRRRVLTAWSLAGATLFRDPAECSAAMRRVADRTKRSLAYVRIEATHVLPRARSEAEAPK